MSGTLPTGGYPNWIDPSTGEHCYAKTGSKRLGQSPPPKCLCGHDFHAGTCNWSPSADTHGILYCHCPEWCWLSVGVGGMPMLPSGSSLMEEAINDYLDKRLEDSAA